MERVIFPADTYRNSTSACSAPYCCNRRRHSLAALPSGKLVSHKGSGSATRQETKNKDMSQQPAFTTASSAPPSASSVHKTGGSFWFLGHLTTPRKPSHGLSTRTAPTMLQGLLHLPANKLHEKPPTVLNLELGSGI